MNKIDGTKIVICNELSHAAIMLFDKFSKKNLLFTDNDCLDYRKPICELINENENEEIIFYGGQPYIYKDGCRYRAASINERALVLNFLNKIYNEGQNI